MTVLYHKTLLFEFLRNSKVCYDDFEWEVAPDGGNLEFQVPVDNVDWKVKFLSWLGSRTIFIRLTTFREMHLILDFKMYQKMHCISKKTLIMIVRFFNLLFNSQYQDPQELVHEIKKQCSIV